MAGPNVNISNATVTIPEQASGSFNGVNSNIGINNGVLLSSGDVNNAPNPNNTSRTGDNLKLEELLKWMV